MTFIRILMVKSYRKKIEKPIEEAFDKWDIWGEHETKFGPKYFTTMLTLNDKINLQKYNRGEK